MNAVVFDVQQFCIFRICSVSFVCKVVKMSARDMWLFCANGISMHKNISFMLPITKELFIIKVTCLLSQQQLHSCLADFSARAGPS